MPKLNCQHLFFLTLLLCFSNKTFSMEVPLRPLNWIEREIFLTIVEDDGIESIKKQLGLTELSEDYTYDPIVMELKLYCIYKRSKSKKGEDDRMGTLLKMMCEAVTKKEEKEKYIPEQIEIMTVAGCFVLNKNNFLGDYTEYWHEKDDKGDYVKCRTIFTEKEVLQDIIKQMSSD